MIVGLPKRTLLALPLAFKRKGKNGPLATPERTKRVGLFASFAMMMERQADLVLRGLGD